ncbi:MAG: hypothetical protein LBS43_00360 [Prevotellaceae bacterium]|jgi:hypothetical protein|nr:hypothetical protein [Prevotellaceae bacterium]
MKIKVFEKNSIIYGLIVSIVLPLILFTIVYLVKFHDYGYSNVWEIPQLRKSIPKIVSLCIFPNGLIFYGYILKNRLQTMRGMLSGTMILALIAMISYFIL